MRFSDGGTPDSASSLAEDGKGPFLVIEPDGESLKESILAEQTVTSSVQRCAESDGQTLHGQTDNLQVDFVKIGLLTAASHSAKCVAAPRSKFQSEPLSERRRKYAIVSTGIYERITRE